MDEQLTNRIEHELINWDLKQERVGKLFPFEILSNKALLTEKLKLYEYILAKYKKTNSSDEKLTLKIIQREKNTLEKQLFPDVLGRLLRQLFNAFFRKPYSDYHHAVTTRQNLQELDMELEIAGFSELSKQVAERVNQSHEHFNIAASRYIDENTRMEYQLSFFKAHSGQYKLDGYRASLHIMSTTHENRSHYFVFNPANMVNCIESYNLLCGRAVLKDGIWMQFDLCDKDLKDNYRTKEFHLT